MSISMRSLTLMQFRQLGRSRFRKERVLEVLCIPYFWILQIVCYVFLKQAGAEAVPPAVVVIVAACLPMPDFVFKLLFVHDHTVMDAFLKTRPLPQRRWNRFLFLSQCWDVSNLMMPLSVVPCCYMFLPFPGGTALFLSLYAASVCGGCLVMLIKHRGDYPCEKAVRTYLSHAVKPSESGFVFGIQLRSFLRSKRLRNSILYAFILLYLQCVLQCFGPDRPSDGTLVYVLVFLAAMVVPQHGFAVESNCFAGLMTRPVAVSRLLRDKYIMGMLVGTAGFLLCLPLCLITDISVAFLCSALLFTAGFGNLLFLYDAFNAIPMDLFGRTFGNAQGKNFRGYSIMVSFALIAVCYLPIFNLLSGWALNAALSLAGLAGFVLHKPFFRWMERRFQKNRYAFMARYASEHAFRI